jgi:hypothetical protein
MFLLKNVSLKALSKNLFKAFYERANLVEKMIEKTKTEKGWCHLIHCAFCSCGT